MLSDAQYVSMFVMYYFSKMPFYASTNPLSFWHWMLNIELDLLMDIDLDLDQDLDQDQDHDQDLDQDLDLDQGADLELDNISNPKHKDVDSRKKDPVIFIAL